MKLTGMIMIFLSCAGIGRYLSMRLSRRVRQLEQIKLMLTSVQAEIEYCSSPIQSILSKLSSKSEITDLSFVPKALDTFLEGEAFPIAWQGALNDKHCTGALLEEDIDLLRSFGCELGTTDIKGQINICKLHQAMFDERLSKAREIKQKQGKLYSSLGLLSGIGVAVILA